MATAAKFLVPLVVLLSLMTLVAFPLAIHNIIKIRDIRNVLQTMRPEQSPDATELPPRAGAPVVNPFPPQFVTTKSGHVQGSGSATYTIKDDLVDKMSFQTSITVRLDKDLVEDVVDVDDEYIRAVVTLRMIVSENEDIFSDISGPIYNVMVPLQLDHHNGALMAKVINSKPLGFDVKVENLGLTIEVVSVVDVDGSNLAPLDPETGKIRCDVMLDLFW